MSNQSGISGHSEVVGLGSCTVDFFALVPKLIGADEKINATGFEIHAGGVTANNLTQVARLGASAAWIGLLGEDDNARIIREAFAEDGMDLSGIEAVPGERSSFTWIPVDAQGERCIYMFPNITARVTPEQIRTRFGEHIRRARHFHTEASQLPMAPVLEAMRLARAAGVCVIFDLDVAPGDFIAAGLSTEAQMMEALRVSDVLKPVQVRGARTYRPDRLRPHRRTPSQDGPASGGDYHGRRRLRDRRRGRERTRSLLPSECHGHHWRG